MDHLVQDKDQFQALVNTVMNLWVPFKAGNVLPSGATVNTSRSTLLYGVKDRA
jgi:hypothetical protein